MDYEKKYKESLERARNLYKDAIDMGDNLRAKQCEIIFPEFKESEEEKIRKTLIKFHKSTIDIDGIKGEDIIAWLEKQGESSDKIHYWTEEEIEPIISDYLRGAEHYGGMIGRLRCLKPKSLEKQGEQNPTDKVEPKFKVGDWIVNNEHNNVAKVLEINNEQYRLDYCDTIGTVSIKLIDNDYHLWTIQDAKDGDVLVCPLTKGYEGGEQIFMFKSINSRDYVDDCIEYYCRVCEGVFYENKNGYMGTTSSPLYPASKEQRDLLFQKMKEAGYTFDFKKKELKKINSYCQEHCKGYQETGKCFFDGECQAKKAAESAWSEDDEKKLNQLHKLIVKKAYEEYEIDTEDETLYGKWLKLDNWLKSLKERLKEE